jgi:hypothetical protein
MKTCMATTETIDQWVETLRQAGCKVVRDREAGTVIAKDGDVDVYRAIQKGMGGPWIVMMRDSDHIQWKTSQATNKKGKE